MIPAILGAAGPLFNLIDDLFTSDEERAEARRKMEKMAIDGELQKVMGQLQINMKEAESENWFVSGWRPFVGWVCGASLAWEYLLKPFAVFVAIAGDIMTKEQIALLPALELSVMMPVLMGMLGLGGMRSFEKWKGANKNR
jgi:hypothetical protein